MAKEGGNNKNNGPFGDYKELNPKRDPVKRFIQQSINKMHHQHNHHQVLKPGQSIQQSPPKVFNQMQQLQEQMESGHQENTKQMSTPTLNQASSTAQ